MHRLAVKDYVVMALQYWHRTKLKSKLVILCVLTFVGTILCRFWFEQMDSSGTTGSLLPYLNGKVCNQNEKGICDGTSTSNMTQEHEIVVSVDSETRQNWTLYKARFKKRHRLRNTSKLSYHNLVLEAHEWGIKPSASNRTNGRFLIYNRVSKCASSTLLGLFAAPVRSIGSWQLSLQRNNNFKYYHSKKFNERQLTMQQEKEFLEWLTVTKNANFVYQFPFAMDRHMYFINAEVHNVEKGEKVNFTALEGKYVLR